MYLKPPAKMPYKLAWGKHFKVLRKKPYHNRYLWELRHADCSPVLQKQERPLTWKEREKEISETIHFSKRRLHFVQNKESIAVHWQTGYGMSRSMKVENQPEHMMAEPQDEGRTEIEKDITRNNQGTSVNKQQNMQTFFCAQKVTQVKAAVTLSEVPFLLSALLALLLWGQKIFFQCDSPMHPFLQIEGFILCNKSGV